MYVVRRSFRNFNQMLEPGSVVEPGNVKRFKSRLNDGHIVEVTERDFDRWNAYFKGRFGVEIKVEAPKANTVDAPKAKTVDAPKAKTVEAPKAKTVEAKKIISK